MVKTKRATKDSLKARKHENTVASRTISEIEGSHEAVYGISEIEGSQEVVYGIPFNDVRVFIDVEHENGVPLTIPIAGNIDVQFMVGVTQWRSDEASSRRVRRPRWIRSHTGGSTSIPLSGDRAKVLSSVRTLGHCSSGMKLQINVVAANRHPNPPGTTHPATPHRLTPHRLTPPRRLHLQAQAPLLLSVSTS
ncbi:hypothetical protein SDJN02_09659, partial [Cucurbita argyrosperma subsp. argyrosperma]